MFKGDPSYYLNLTEDEISKIKKLQGYILKDTKYNETKYLEAIKIYKEILLKLSNLLKENIKNDILVYNGALSSIIWNGYLSYQKDFKFEEDGNKLQDLNGYFGIDVMLGRGCCRNIAMLFKDILNISDFETYYIVNYEHDIKCDYVGLNINRYKVNGEKMEKCGFNGYQDDGKFIGNHACILFKYQNNFFVYDPTNIQIYHMKNYKGNLILGNGKIAIYPDSLMLYSNFSIDEMNDYINNIKKNKRIYDEKIIERLYEGANDVKNNQDVFNGFHNSIQDQLEELNYQLVKLYQKNNQYS